MSNTKTKVPVLLQSTAICTTVATAAAVPLLLMVPAVWTILVSILYPEAGSWLRACIMIV